MTEVVVFDMQSAHALSKNMLRSTKSNAMLLKVLDAINENEELQTLWHVANVHAIERLGITDHGPSHFWLVAENSLKFLQLLTDRKVSPSIVKDFGLTKKHAEVVVLLAALFHDIGMSVNREGHEEFSVTITNMMLKEMLGFMPVRERTIVISEILHAIINHRRSGQPLTLEAGIVRVTDALDMENGRCRIPYEAGKIDIHNVSAMAVDSIEFRAGKDVAIDIDIVMNHNAGVFHIDELLSEKIKGSGLEPHLNITVYICNDGKRELFRVIPPSV